MKKIINLIKELWEMVKYYSTAPFECAFCPYYARCKQEIDEPEDNPDGTCKQKDIYEEEIEK